MSFEVRLNEIVVTEDGHVPLDFTKLTWSQNKQTGQFEIDKQAMK